MIKSHCWVFDREGKDRSKEPIPLKVYKDYKSQDHIPIGIGQSTYFISLSENERAMAHPDTVIMLDFREVSDADFDSFMDVGQREHL